MKMLRKPPEGLETRTITRWLSGEVWHANQAHIEYVLRYYAKLPDRLVPPTQGDSTNRGRIEITSEMVESLRGELKRTGLSAPQAVKLAAMPAGISAHRINNWKRGTVQRVPPQLWGAVTAALAAQPDYAPVLQAGRKKLPKAPSVQRSTLDWKLLDALRAHKKRTRTGAQALLSDWGDEKPERLTKAMVNAWLSGRIRKTNPDLFRAVLERYASLPDDDRLAITTPPRERKEKKSPFQKPPHRQVAYVPITPEWIAAIKVHRARTGVYDHVFIRDWADKPQGLTFAVLGSWLNGKTRTANPALLAAVMHRYEGLPGK